MLRAYLIGAGAAARRWSLVIGLWIIFAAFGLAFALASGAWLNDALDGSLVTRTLSRDIDADVIVDLWYHHREGLRMLLIVALVLATVHAVLWWWLHGVVICSVQDDTGERGLGVSEARDGIWTRGFLLTPVMARLFAIALIVLALFSAAVGGAAYGLMRWTPFETAPLLWYQVGGGGVAVWVIGLVFLVAVHDHARLHAARTGAGAFAAYRWAFAFVGRGGERAFPLACALQASAVVLWLAYQIVGFSFPMTAILDLTGSLLWGEAYLLVRVWVRVWFFAAQNQIQP